MKNKPTPHKKRLGKFVHVLIIRMAGAIPKVVKSAIESNWEPNLLEVFIMRASLPSKASNAIAATINQAAISN
jgi:hypothetical protein